MTTLGLAPFTAFGALSLALIRDASSGGLPDWAPQPVLVARHVPGSNTTVRQNMGAGALTVQWLVRLASDTDAQTFMGMIGTAATLRLRDTATGWPGTRSVLYSGDAYKEVDNVTLTAVTAVTRRLDGTVLVTATFERDKP